MTPSWDPLWQQTMSFPPKASPWQGNRSGLQLVCRCLAEGNLVSLSRTFPHHLSSVSFHSITTQIFLFRFPGTLISFLVHVLHIFIALSYRSCYHFSIVLSILVLPDQIFFWAFLPSLFPSFLPTFCPSFSLQTLPRFSHCYEMLSRIRD